MPTKVRLGRKGAGIYKGTAGFLNLKQAFDDAQRKMRWKREELVYSEGRADIRQGRQIAATTDIAKMQAFPYKYLQDQGVGGRLATGAGPTTETRPLTGGEREKLLSTARTQGRGDSLLTEKSRTLALDFLKRGTRTITREALPQAIGDLGMKEVRPGLLVYDDPVKGRQFIKTQEAEQAYKMIDILLKAQDLELTRDFKLQDLQLKRDRLEQEGKIERAKLLDKGIDRREKSAMNVALKKLGFMEKRAQGPMDADYLTELGLSPEEENILGVLPTPRFEARTGLGRLGRRGFKPRPAFERVLTDFDEVARQLRGEIGLQDVERALRTGKVKLRSGKVLKLRRSEMEVLLDRARQLYR